jgi:hypothetical protein
VVSIPSWTSVTIVGVAAAITNNFALGLPVTKDAHGDKTPQKGSALEVLVEPLMRFAPYVIRISPRTL